MTAWTRCIVAWISLLIISSGVHAASTVAKLSFGRFGETLVYKPTIVRHVALFFSDENGWTAADAALAEALADQGVLVAGIDMHHYATELAKPRDKCSYIAGEFEDYSHELQKRYSPDRYHMPVLIGIRKSASLVYAVAAQGSSGTFLGTLTLGFNPRWVPPLKLCQSYELRYAVDKKGVATLKPSEQLSTPWIALQASGDKAFGVNDIQEFVTTVGTAKAIIVTTDDSSALQTAPWRDAVIANVELLAQPDSAPKIVADELRDLPLEEVVAAGKQSHRMALFATGDGGWANLDKQVSALLAKQGVSVVALNSLQYFWKEKSPAQASADVARILRHYLAAWKKDEVIVIGYSFGADALPFIVNRLPADLQSKIRTVNLLGLGSNADFEVHVTGWVGVDHHGPATKPEVDKLSMPLLCVYGDGEKDTLCPELTGAKKRSMKIGDGHHFGDKYAELVEQIMSLADSQ